VRTFVLWASGVARKAFDGRSQVQVQVQVQDPASEVLVRQILLKGIDRGEFILFERFFIPLQYEVVLIFFSSRLDISRDEYFSMRISLV
jgi:hypothetical protein